MMAAGRMRALLVVVITGVAAGCGSSGPPSPSTHSASPSAVETASASATATPFETVINNPTNVNAPSPRSGAAMAFDPVSNRMILFGGLGPSPSSSRLDDTWAWDGHVWTRLEPADSPPALFTARLVLDPSSGRLVLVSGMGSSDANGFPQQEGMWQWTGSDWTRLADNPVQDVSPDVATDPATGQVLLDAAGDTGAGPNTPPPIYVGGAYVWSGQAWATAPAHLSGDGIMGYHNAAIAYDPISRRVIEFGGAQQAVFNDTRAWDGTQWTTIVPGGVSTALPPADVAIAATDDASNEIVMLAGPVENQSLATTWTWDGQAWHRHVVNEPPPPSSVSLAYDPQVGGIVLFGGAPSGHATSTMYLWQGTGWTRVPA